MKKLTGREEIVHVERREAKLTDGEALQQAEASAQLATAEGRRLDKVLAEASRAFELAMKYMEGACRLHQQMADTLLAHEKQRGDETAQLLTAYRDTFLRLVQAEGDATAAELAAQQQPDGSVESQLITGFAEGLMARASAGANGAKK